LIVLIFIVWFLRLVFGRDIGSHGAIVGFGMIPRLGGRGGLIQNATAKFGE
jgi:hypothetical protein